LHIADAQSKGVMRLVNDLGYLNRDLDGYFVTGSLVESLNRQGLTEISRYSVNTNVWDWIREKEQLEKLITCGEKMAGTQFSRDSLPLHRYNPPSQAWLVFVLIILAPFAAGVLLERGREFIFNKPLMQSHVTRPTQSDRSAVTGNSNTTSDTKTTPNDQQQRKVEDRSAANQKAHASVAPKPSDNKTIPEQKVQDNVQFKATTTTSDNTQSQATISTASDTQSQTTTTTASEDAQSSATSAHENKDAN
jgi:hypothetical protein